jgi:lipopolysaccharide/colanic/teichoic acid biosynthesis glycosyltransferase
MCFAVHPSQYFRWKAILGRAMAFVLMIPGGPITLMLMILIRLTSRGPAIYRQLRVGKNGKTFLIYKLRTMRHDAESYSGPAWTQENDPRITRIGRVLRKMHLDELPQLLNVLRGDMDLIGPRPERPEFAKVLVKEIPGYLNRLAVLPGVTGLAQINLPPDTDLDSVRRKLALDLEYIEKATFALDMRMFAGTLLRMFGIHGESVIGMFGLLRTVGGTNGVLATASANGKASDVGPVTPISISGARTHRRNGKSSYSDPAGPNGEHGEVAVERTGKAYRR